MADVKIIDIDSEQWNMKDQKARDDLDTLKQSLAARLENIFMGNIDNNKFSIPNNRSEVTAQYTGFFYATMAKSAQNTTNIYVKEDNNIIATSDQGSGGSLWVPCFLIIRKGHVYKFDNTDDSNAQLRNQNFIPFNFG